MFVIPRPSYITDHQGDFFKITPNTKVIILQSEENKQLDSVARLGYQCIELFIKKSRNTIIEYSTSVDVSDAFIIDLKFNQELAFTNVSRQEYELEISNRNVIIRAHHEQGIFYALQTLKQLLILDDKLPCVTVNDRPRFGWRGMLFDSCRHFFSKVYVMKTIDRLALYKMNVKLHIVLYLRLHKSSWY
jgi:hexosaminidase